MRSLLATCRPVTILALSLVAAMAAADTWGPPQTEVALSADGRFRATVTPRPLGGALPYFKDKVEGVEPAGQRSGEAQISPVARVEQSEKRGRWHLLWQGPLVNDVGPAGFLLAKDATFLVTFDNWHSAGFGDDVIVIYDRQGNLVRKLSLEEILPPAYVNNLPRSVSSRWWGGKHRLVSGDRFVELQVVEPGDRWGEVSTYAPVRVRLEDGEVMPPGGPAWELMVAKASALESHRLAAWEELRQLRASPLVPPASRDTREWRRYMFELRDRIASEGERMGGMVLAAADEDPGFHDAYDVSEWIEDFDGSKKYGSKSLIFVSPTSETLSDLLAKSFLARADDSMQGAHVVFVGKVSEGERVIDAARHTGARVTAIDQMKPFPAGEPLPKVPPPLWKPRIERR